MDNRRIYYSFSDLSDSSPQTYEIRGLRSAIKFSHTEIIHIIIAMAVLTVAFAFVFVPYPGLEHIGDVVNTLPLSFLAIATAFFCHEIAHKYMGQHFGYWSEFRMFPQGLLLALFLGIAAGIVFAAPGAVQIFGRPPRDESGKISAAGPTTNVAIAAIFTAIWLTTSDLIGEVALFIASINAFLAFFNLLPIGPLDGRKIMAWRIDIWGLLICSSVGLFAMQFVQ